MNARTELTISWVTILKILVACVLVYVVIRLAPLLQLLFLALLLALSLAPVLRWTQRKGWPRWTSLFLCGVLLFGSAFLFFGLLLPTIASQGGALIGNLPRLRDQILAQLPSSGPVRDSADHIMGASAFSHPEPLAKQILSWASFALEGVAKFFLMLVIALYFLADGKRVSEWLLALLPRVQRKKAAEAAKEITSVVSHYVAGQLVTSALCGAYAFVVLAVLHVPNALALAVLAAVLDVLPLIGFFLFTIPAIAVASSVSGTTALIVAALYIAYKFAEDYFIVPLVYGNALKLSTLTVLLACLAAGAIGGVVGIIVILPVVASYPVIERVWLRPYLQGDTVPRHEQIDRKASG
ncbi:MAG: AI-2E family transporter [Verrucomicrobiota bacterium]|nr:AI-2E family transporter [Verrucomicrobiota bacterium]